MVEVLTVAVVMGTLVRMAMPNFHEVVLRARAAEVAGDFETVRLAVLNYQADHLAWPVDTYAGQIPPGLAEYLPDGFSFDGPGYRLDWENWVLPNGMPQNPAIPMCLSQIGFPNRLRSKRMLVVGFFPTVTVFRKSN